MAVSPDQFRTLSRMIGLPLEPENKHANLHLIEGKTASGQELGMEIKEHQEAENVTRTVEHGDGFHFVPWFREASDDQLVNITLDTPGVNPDDHPRCRMISLIDPSLRFIPEESEIADSQTLPERAILTDREKKIVVFESSGTIRIDSEGLPDRARY